jgi:hypothetical protein
MALRLSAKLDWYDCLAVARPNENDNSAAVESPNERKNNSQATAMSVREDLGVKICESDATVPEEGSGWATRINV